jgi:hypothetical protein
MCTQRIILVRMATWWIAIAFAELWYQRVMNERRRVKKRSVTFLASRARVAAFSFIRWINW